MAEPSFPKPATEDSEDVAWALETAGALWARGDAREAIRWIRRAAETASDHGRDTRAVDLAKTAAELATELKIPPSMPPPPMNAGATVPEGGTIPDRAGQPRAASGTAVSPDFADGRDRHPAPPVDVAKVARPAVTDPEPTMREDIDEQTVRTEIPDGFRRVEHKSGMTVRTRQGLRVSVLPSHDERGLLMVRVLSEDEVPEPGAHEAMLVAFEAGAHLLSKKR